MKKILIQEGDESIRDVIRLALEAVDLDVVLVAECNECLSSIHQIRPVLVVLDFVYDGFNAISLCSLIKSAYPLLPVLAISCNDHISDCYARFGFSGYIIKPFDLELLCRTIRAHIQKSTPFAEPNT